MLTQILGSHASYKLCNIRTFQYQDIIRDVLTPQSPANKQEHGLPESNAMICLTTGTPYLFYTFLFKTRWQFTPILCSLIFSWTPLSGCTPVNCPDSMDLTLQNKPQRPRAHCEVRHSLLACYLAWSMPFTLFTKFLLSWTVTTNHN
jgi:hypothetical protein